MSDRRHRLLVAYAWASTVVLWGGMVASSITDQARWFGAGTAVGLAPWVIAAYVWPLIVYARTALRRRRFLRSYNRQA